MASFEIKSLTFFYPGRAQPALDGIDLTINDGEFVVICGKSGCGKSTLLRHLKTVLTPHGKRTGQILFHGAPLEEADLREQAGKIGFVLQSPENQIVTDKVWHELAFGLESLGIDSQTIRLRVAEMASFFGIQQWFSRNVTELSGGQKQLLNLASVMVMQPEVLILDEPTSQLDPIAASEFLQTVRKINRELGVAVIMTEHRLDEIFSMADRAVVMDQGRIIAAGIPREVAQTLKNTAHDMFTAMPAPMQIYAGVENQLPCPVTVKDGRDWLSRLFEGKKPTVKSVSVRKCQPEEETVIALKEVWFRYDKNMPDVIKDLTLEIKKGQFFCLVGGNGTGKTTALNLICGINRPYRGKVMLGGKDISKYSSRTLFNRYLGVLPQNPQALFVEKTVRLDLYEMFSDSNYSQIQKDTIIQEIVQLTEIEPLLDMHPYDLSGGEQQRAALAKVLLLEPKILLLDEPTKGIDSFFKCKLAQILQKLTRSGVTIVMVSHDVDFCARYADMCAMFFDGNIVTVNAPNRFFSGNSFYTTAANRMSRHIFDNAVTNEDVIALCRMRET